MRIGVVGPGRSVDSVLAEAAKVDIPIVCLPLRYEHYAEAVQLVANARSEVDAFLFTGATPYKYAILHMQPEEPWAFLPHSVTSLLSAMLKAVYFGGYDIRRLSVDSYEKELLHAAYEEIGITDPGVAVLAHSFTVESPDYVAKLTAFHRGNLQSGRATFCLSGVESVYAALLADGLPVTKIFATSEIIAQQLQNLYIRHQLDAPKGNNVAVLSVQFVLSRERSLYGKSDMQFFLYKTRAMNELYAFAQRIGAAVEAHANTEARIYSTELTMEMETRGFAELPLLRDIQKLEGIVQAAMGIGIGKLPADAKYHADIARDRALRVGHSGFFIMRDDHRIAGPIVDFTQKHQTDLVDRDFNTISRRAGVGPERLHQIERGLQLRGLDSATPGELAAICGISLCTMNRIIAKLEKAGYCRIIGRQHSRTLGRPSRLVQILFHG